MVPSPNRRSREHQSGSIPRADCGSFRRRGPVQDRGIAPPPVCRTPSIRRGTPSAQRHRPETVRLHRGIGVHLHPGIAFTFLRIPHPGSRRRASRERVRKALPAFA
jgi:hypothetical protein